MIADRQTTVRPGRRRSCTARRGKMSVHEGTALGAGNGFTGVDINNGGGAGGSHRLEMRKTQGMLEAQGAVDGHAGDEMDSGAAVGLTRFLSASAAVLEPLSCTTSSCRFRSSVLETGDAFRPHVLCSFAA